MVKTDYMCKGNTQIGPHTIRHCNIFKFVVSIITTDGKMEHVINRIGSSSSTTWNNIEQELNEVYKTADIPKYFTIWLQSVKIKYEF